MSPDFLTLEEVLEIHSPQLARFGGAAGVRDVGLLESVLSQPQASFGGQYVHEDLFEMASAYLFHVVSNHPFIDGNKRTALVAAELFPELNGFSLDAPEEECVLLTLSVAAGKNSEKETADWMNLTPKSRELLK